MGKWVSHDYKWSEEEIEEVEELQEEEDGREIIQQNHHTL